MGDTFKTSKAWRGSLWKQKADRLEREVEELKAERRYLKEWLMEERGVSGEYVERALRTDPQVRRPT